MGELARQLRDLLLTQRRWDAAAELLRRHADEAADAIVALPFEQQQLLFRNLPLDLAAKLAGHFLYFHAYVLLCSLTTPEIAAIMGAMGSTERDQFLDALPEESWRSLMNTLDEAHLMAAEAKAPVTEPTPVLPVEDLQPILEARQIAKGYQQPEGERFKWLLQWTCRLSQTRSSRSSAPQVPVSPRSGECFPGSLRPPKGKFSGTANLCRNRTQTSRSSSRASPYFRGSLFSKM